MTIRTYYVEVTVTATVKMDDALFEATAKDPEWRGRFYNLINKHELVEHLTFNAIEGREMTSLDGFADRKESDVSVSEVEWMDWHVIELSPPARSGSR